MKDEPFFEGSCFGCIAIGLAIMFICLGIGGCSYLIYSGEALRDKVTEESK